MIFTTDLIIRTSKLKAQFFIDCLENFHSPHPNYYARNACNWLSFSQEKFSCSENWEYSRFLVKHPILIFWKKLFSQKRVNDSDIQRIDVEKLLRHWTHIESLLKYCCYIVTNFVEMYRCMTGTTNLHSFIQQALSGVLPILFHIGNIWGFFIRIHHKIKAHRV